MSAGQPTGQRLVEDLWRSYAACWSLGGDDRVVGLDRCVVAGVVYTDPQSTIEGAEGLSAYMAGFQRDVRGGRFEILTVQNHHDRSLARWRLRGDDGVILQTGTSAAVHSPDGRLETITGFFDAPPDPGGAEP